jgi:putative nucleotidyltransferase with HDIG domain
MSVSECLNLSAPAEPAAHSPNFALRKAWSAPIWNTVYLAAVIGGGIVALLASIVHLLGTPVGLPWFLLAGLTVLSGSATLRLSTVAVSFSVSDTFTIAAALLFGPAAGTVVVAIDSLVISSRLARRNLGWQRLLFNATAPALAMWISARCFFAIVGVGPLIDASVSLGHLIVPLLAFAGLYFILNTGSTALAVAFEQFTSPIVIWRSHFLPLWPTHFGGTAVALLLMTFMRYHDGDLIVLGLVASIPLVLYATFKSTIGRVEDQVAHLGHINRMYLGTIETLAHAIDAKDQVTHGHIRRVQQHAMRLAAALGIDSETELRALEAASLLHDTGKLAVPEHILNKPAKLTHAEFEVMKRHATIGADILSTVEFPFPVVPIVRHHHENWDGTGYPAGLKGEDIPIGARILAVVDCYDALTSDRPYRPKMTVVEALAILQQRSGTMYQPQIVSRFVELAPADLQTVTPMVASSALAAITETIQSETVRRWNDAATAYDAAILTAIYNLGADIAIVRDGDQLVDVLHSRLAQLMFAACTVVYVYEARTDELVGRFASGAHADLIRGVTMPLGQRLSGWVAAQRSTIVNSDAALDLGNLAIRLTPSLQTCLSTALCADEDLIGAISVYSSSAQPFTERHAAMIETLALSIAPTLRIHCRRR